MQIDPMVVHSFFTEPRLREPTDSKVLKDVEPSPFQRQGEQVPQSDLLTSLQSQFTSLMKELNKEFAALEKRFSAAIGQLAKSYESAEGIVGTTSPQPGVQRQRYASIVNTAAQRHEIDPALLNAVIHQESGFNPRALSAAGAQGLMQLMPETARSLGVRDPYDPAENVDGGARLLRQLLDRYHGKLDSALAAYNAGSGAVDKYGGVPPFAETQRYVRAILSNYRGGVLTTTPA